MNLIVSLHCRRIGTTNTFREWFTRTGGLGVASTLVAIEWKEAYRDGWIRQWTRVQYAYIGTA
jgi:hypothetical protein